MSQIPSRGGARRGRRRFRAVVVGVVMLAAALAAAAIAIVGRPLVVPDWAQARIEARISDLVPGARLGFEEMRLVVGDAGLVRVRLEDAALRAPDGAPIAAVSRIEIAASALPLLEGRVVLRQARVEGAFLSAGRDENGRFGIGLGIGIASGGRPSVPDAVARIDAALADPRLADLREVTLDGLTIVYEDRRAGREWVAEGGRIAIERDGPDDGTLRLSGSAALLGEGDRAATLSLSAESVIGASDLSFGMSLEDLPARDIATQSPALAWLEALDAPISGSLRGWTARDGALGGLDATLRIGAGVLQPTEAARPVRFDGAQTYFSFAPETGVLDFTEISVDSSTGRARASGRAQIAPGTGWPGAITGQFILTEIAADPAGLFSAPVEIGRAELDLKLSLRPFALEIGRLRIADEDMPLSASGRVGAGAEGWSVAVDATAARMSPEAVTALWPESVAPGIRTWIAERILGAEARDASLGLRWQPGMRPELYVDLGFEEASVRFADTLPPVEGGTGRFVYGADRLSVRLDRGTITPPEGGPIALAGTTFAILDTRQDPATGRLDLVAEGPARAALSFIDQPPLSLLSKAGRTTALATGSVRVTGTITRPLGPGVTFADTGFALAGTLRDVESVEAVAGRTLTANRLDLSVTNEAVRIGGEMALDGVPFDGAWTLPLGEEAPPARIAGTATISAEAAEAFGIGLPPGLLSGAGPAEVTVELPSGGPPRFRLSSRLAGIGMSIPQVGWSLARGTQGTLEVAGTLGETPAVDTLGLDAGGLRATGQVLLSPGGGLDRVRLARVRIGSWLDAPVTLVGRGGASPRVEVGGGQLDLRGLDTGGGSGGGAGGGGTPIDVRLDRLTISEGISLEDFSGRFTARGDGLDGGFTATMAITGAPVTGQLLPQNGGTGLRLLSEDAGDVLESTGILRTVAGGRLVLNLTPTGAPGTYDGAVTVTDARLRDAPAIGALLDAISIVGIIDQLEGPGIYFQDVEARFRLSPNRVTVTQSSAVGPSMGVSLDGYVDLATGGLDLQGVLSPVYVLNSIGSIFTRRGEGLLGFNFTIEGSGAAPRVAVNPLSVFTPGMFREIFRRPAPTTR